MWTPTETPARSGAIVLRRAEYAYDHAGEFCQELSALGGGVWTLDFRNVHYIDSSCLGELIRALKRMHASDPAARIEIVNACDLVKSIFKMTCLDTLFHLDAQGM